MLTRLRPKLNLYEIVKAFINADRGSIGKFETHFSNISHQKYSVVFPYGRTGIYALLKALIEAGKGEVICPAYTCVVVPHAIVKAGFTPVFVDSEANGYNMDLDLLEKAITSNTVAIIVTSIFGIPAKVDRIKELRRKYPHVIFIQDCAHSFFCSEKNEVINKLGDAAIYGLNISKMITSIYGGMVTTDDKVIAEKLIEFRESSIEPSRNFGSVLSFVYILSVYFSFNRVIYGLVNFLERKGFLNRFVKYYDDSKIELPKNFNIQISNFQAEFGSWQCGEYESIVSHRRRISEIYYNKLKEHKDLRLMEYSEGGTFSHFVIYTEQANDIVAHCLRKGFQLGELIDYHIPSMKSYQKFRYINRSVSECYPSNIVNLPVHYYVSVDDAIDICNIIKLCLDSDTRNLK